MDKLFTAMQSVSASINLVLVASFLEEIESMEAIVDSLPSIREERPVDVPVERDVFFGVRRDDRRDMLQSVLLKCMYGGGSNAIMVEAKQKAANLVPSVKSAIFDTNSTVRPFYVNFQKFPSSTSCMSSTAKQVPSHLLAFSFSCC